MAKHSVSSLDYGPRKYAALHLMFSRWLWATSPTSSQYVYVTLGGTELRDVQSLRFIGNALTSKVFSFEYDRDYYQLAAKTAKQLQMDGIDIELSNDNFFSYKRATASPHIFFLDLPGICAWSDYDRKFGDLFGNEVIREGDCLIITSHLGHRLKIETVLKTYASEFEMLGIINPEAAKKAFRCFHPSLTLYKALCRMDLTAELRLTCLGCIKYRDEGRTTMGLYGYTISQGATALKNFIQDSTIRYFDMIEVRHCALAEF